MSSPSSPIPVLHFTNSTARGGVEEHILQILAGLDPKQFVQSWVCSPETERLVRRDVPAGVDLIALDFRKPAHLRGGLSLARILRAKKIEILHSHLFYSSLFASPVGKLCRVPVIIETPHVRESWRTGSLKSRFVIDRWAGYCVDRYIAVSQANANYLVADKGLPAKKIAVIRNGCDLDRFSPERPQTGWRGELGFRDNDPVLLVVARLAPQKGHAVLIAALPAIRRQFPNVRLICAGDGELRKELEAQVSELGLADAVRFVGHQSNIGEWFSRADVMVLPSLYEGLPLVAIEAMAAGCPVVATAVDGTPEVVNDGRTGYCVPPGNPEVLTTAICGLLAHPDRRSEFSKAGQLWVRQHFSKERQLRQTQELYRQLLQRKLRGRRGWQRLAEPYAPPAGTGKGASEIA